MQKVEGSNPFSRFSGGPLTERASAFPSRCLNSQAVPLTKGRCPLLPKQRPLSAPISLLQEVFLPKPADISVLRKRPKEVVLLGVKANLDSYVNRLAGRIDL
jgi:hypothetical protein